jgi:phospho-N-acetylmuramoyl-pentapeptide-transferase
MLYHLFEYLDQSGVPLAGLCQYITFRALAAIIISLVISMLFGGRIINYLRRLQIGETVRDLGLAGQKEKQCTPTMGGIIIIMAIIVPCLLLAKLDSTYIILMLIATIWMGAIGFLDDYIKIFKKDKEGLKGRFKIMGQVGLGLLVGLVMFKNDEVVLRMDAGTALEQRYDIVEYVNLPSPNDPLDTLKLANVKTTLTNIPFIAGNNFDYASIAFFLDKNSRQTVGWVLFILLVIFIVTAVSNAANLCRATRYSRITWIFSISPVRRSWSYSPPVS